MEISQAGSSQQKPLRVTNVIAHAPGIKLLNGLAKTSTSGGHDLRLPLPSPYFYSRRRQDWTIHSSLLLLARHAG